MSKQLPTFGFVSMTDDELDDWKHLSCFLQVDLEYPDEADGKQIVEFVGLRAKLYSIKMLDGSEHKKCKGMLQEMLQKEVFNSMTTESACLAGRNNIEK